MLATAGIDTAHVNRVVVLDPAQFSLRNGMEDDTMDALRTAMGLGRGVDQLPVQWASSAVFAVANTQRRAIARAIATEYLARQKALAAQEVQGDDDLRSTGSAELAAAKEQLEKAIKRAYQHVVFLAQPDPDGERVTQEHTFDSENLTSLDGTMVWKALAEREKVFDAGQFSAKALVHNLRGQDHGRSLSEIRSAFYNAPRLPLLYNGDTDLQHAIYDAAVNGLLRIVDANGRDVAVTAPNQVNLSSTSLRLTRPVAPCPHCGSVDDPHVCGDPGSTQPAAGGDQPSRELKRGDTAAVSPTTGLDDQSSTTSRERHLSLSLTRNLLNNDEDADNLVALLRSIYVAIDERHVSYLQATMNLLVSDETAQTLIEKASESGIPITQREV